MGQCNIDHTHEDVVNKLNSQEAYLPSWLTSEIQSFLTKEHAQDTLNELFHLLKKYDLSSENEQGNRNEKMKALIGASE
ncbi:group-specific protein [Virgibacillus ihumii]|uniref:group-specific protein n=1 Tax=Virgibacillus ihumii TaxID=2686091 RepID=UPI00157C51C6|nr:group-specific protein [Virgibacillus ihumii]